jgi:hypothetical protein
VQTPKRQALINVSDDSGDNLSIVPPGCRTYTEAERRQVEAEVKAKYVYRLTTQKGLRLWWLKWQMRREIDARLDRMLTGIDEGI